MKLISKYSIIILLVSIVYYFFIKEYTMNSEQKKELYFDNFTVEQITSWNKVLKPWIDEKFREDFLLKYNLKQDCVDCSDILVFIKFQTNELGKITFLKEVEDAIDCSPHISQEIRNLKMNMINSFIDLVMPKNLRNLIIIAPIGQSTFC